MNTSDPLHGYRDTSDLSEEELIERDIAALHNIDVDADELYLMREVIKSETVQAELNKEGPLKWLAAHIVTKLDEARKTWEMESDPASTRAKMAHSEARAARIVINWIQDVLVRGQVAGRQLEVNQENERQA